MKYFIAMLALMMSACSCSTTEKEAKPALLTCAEFLQERIATLQAEGFEVVGGGEQITMDGAMIVGQLARDDGTLMIDALVDNGVLVKKAKKEGLKEAGKCLLGDRAWTLMTAKQKVKALPGKDAI